MTTTANIIALVLLGVAAGVLLGAFDRSVRRRFGPDVISAEIRRDAKRAICDVSRLLR